MATCEKCWADAYIRLLDHPMKSQTEHYQDLLEERKSNPCTPEQQRGHIMNTGCPDCDRNFIDNQDYCPKHKVEYLKAVAENAQLEYEESKTQYERKQSELSNS